MPAFKRIACFMLVFLLTAPALAQTDECPAIVESALKSVGDVCAVRGSNLACYGNRSLQAEAQPGVENLIFDQPGDVARVATLRSLQLQPFDLENQEWGVALLRLQANIPDTLPGQSVVFLLFGDVQIENQVQSPPATPITLSADSVMLGTPQQDGPIVGALSQGESAFALSRSADGLWLRVERDASDASTGWIPAALQPETGDLPVYDAAAPAPMQAFSLRTGVGGVSCDAAPEDGILVQTPGESLQIELTVNDVNIKLGSTALLRAQPSRELTVSVLEGKGQVEALGQTIEVPAGTWVKVPMDENLEPTGVINPATGYNTNTLDNLPLTLLERPVEIAPPAGSQVGASLCVSNPNGAWLRDQPDSASQTIVRVLADGENVTVTGESSNDSTQDWQPVQTADGQASGWVEAASLAACTAPVMVDCTPRADWTILYTVQRGNTLAQIAQAAGLPLNDLAQANCIADVNRIASGQQLRVPRPIVIPTATPGATPAPTATSAPPFITGGWVLTWTVQQVDCQTTAPPPPEVTTVQAYIEFSPDGQSATISVTQPFTLRRSGTNTFSGSIPDINYGATLTITGSNQGAMYVTKPCDPPVSS